MTFDRSQVRSYTVKKDCYNSTIYSRIALRLDFFVEPVRMVLARNKNKRTQYMRKITKEAIASLFAGKDYHNDNTTVDGGTLRLHNSAIAEIRHDGLYITTAGWNTTTTKERLNGIKGVRVHTVKHQLMLNGVAWDGQWIKVDTDSNI